MPARLPVGEWQVVHFPSPLKYVCAGLRIAGQDVLDLEQRRAAQRVVDPLAEEVREVLHLRVGQAGARRPALQRWPFFRNGPSWLP